jgi:glutamate synthase domain-containing protein 2/glutamate synthase domain-containing protein 1/glutamate synthase domain-containing protein 3
MLFIREERLLVRLRQLARPVAAGSRGLSTRNPPSLSRFPKPQGLYDAAREVDSCGVGMVAHLKGQASHSIVSDANVMLVRMAHRGGCGCDPASGDGAGILTGMPDGFLRKAVKAELGITLPPAGEYAAGNIFFPKDPAAIAACKGIVESQMRAQGLGLIGWRPLPVDNSELGPTSLESEPHSEMLLVSPKAGLSSADFNRELYRLHKLATKAVHAEPSHEDFYVNSLSTSTIVYKGQLTPEQVWGYFKDLQSPDYASHLALVHSRFSTNTFPSWARAQPFRSLCHNGEINTLRGNKNMMRSREAALVSPYFGAQLDALKPICSDDTSDSGNYDAVAELLVHAGTRPIHEAVMMMTPEAWRYKPGQSEEKRAFYEFMSAQMEPWDGPAMMAFTDGRYVGACLDRNGLRPSRYYVTHDDRVLLSSEVGVLIDEPEANIAIKARLEPGKMFLIDFDQQRIIPDAELKQKVSTQQPYAQWMKNAPRRLDAWQAEAAAAGVTPEPPPPREELNSHLSMFGFTKEGVDVLIAAMVAGKEGLGSMGVDTPLAVLSQQPKPPSHYFKQLFAQVTNPPIDPIREEVVMSLVCPVGPEQNLLDASEAHAARLFLPHPVLSPKEMAAIKSHAHRGWKAVTLDASLPVAEAAAAPDALERAIETLCVQAEAAVRSGGAPLLVISHRNAGRDRLPIPSLLATGAVHQHLIRTQARTQTGLIVESGDALEPHDFCTLVGYGADGVCPFGAYAAVGAFHGDPSLVEEELLETYRYSAGKAMLKVMAKIGISTVQSYKGAQIFEAVGLGPEVMETCFAGTPSRLRGIGFEHFQHDLLRQHAWAWPKDSVSDVMLPNPGDYHYRDGLNNPRAEKHYNTPQGMAALQLAARTNSRKAYEDYVRGMAETVKETSLRGLLTFRDDLAPIDISEVESAQQIVKRFCTGAMSLGSISIETHETLAIAMNHLGGKSNTGEGGEDPKRFLDNRRSSIKQIASGRFGVTAEYLTNADELQIKMAQGAKPGEGGELPGYKVTKLIAKTRGTTRGVGLISPPPHHDIYSIEDLAQLIHDLKSANRTARVSTKLVSEVGVGVVAAGVAKAKSDHIVVSGGDGGTGAAAWTGVKHAGLPWELGLAEAHQTLVLNKLRSRIVLQSDGQLKFGRDVVIAAMLGAEEFGFATTPLIALGCIMMRKCHLNTCPVGIATQDPELRAKFAGKPEHVINFFFLMAEEMRGYMAKLGMRSIEEMVGRSDLLRVDESTLTDKTRTLDLGPILTPAAALAPGEPQVNTMKQDHFSPDATGLQPYPAEISPEGHNLLDDVLIQRAARTLKDGTPMVTEMPINNRNRSVGAMLSNALTKVHPQGLPEDSIVVKMTGHTGQSFGFTLQKGVTFHVKGDANDGCGKGLSGGVIAISPGDEVIASGLVPEEHVILGNCALYGATSGRAFFRGKAGERFCVRNSGAWTVVEGMGDHGCEYMTGGRVVCLGSTGINFGAGMSGGIAYVLDPTGSFGPNVNTGMVELERIETAQEAEEVRALLAEHAAKTGSTVAAGVLANFESTLPHFVKVMPTDYKRVIGEQLAEELANAAAAAVQPRAVAQ